MDKQIRFSCSNPSCGKRLKAPPEHAGRRARCSCGQSVVVPSPAPLPSPGPSPHQHVAAWGAMDPDDRAHMPAGAESKMGSGVPAGSHDPIAELISDLTSPHTEVRLETMVKLRELRDVRAIAPLIAMLRDEDSEIRQEAAYSLEIVGDLRAVKPLITALSDLDGDVRLKAARALGELKAAKAVQALVVLLRDPDEVVRFYVAKALENIGDSVALKALQRALENTTRPAARKAMEEAIATLNRQPRQPQIVALQNVNCPHCGDAVGNHSQFAGSVVTCPHCRRPFRMPALQALQAPSSESPFGSLTETDTDDRPRRLRGEPLTVGDWLVCFFLPVVGGIAGFVRLVLGKAGGGQMIGYSALFAFLWILLRVGIEVLSQR